MTQKIIDIHCHSAIQPNANLNTFENTNQFDSDQRASLWFQDEYDSRWEKTLQQILRLANYTQADFTTCNEGGVDYVFVSLYPIERGFATVEGFWGIRPFKKFFKRFVGKLASSIKNSRLAFIASKDYNYYQELQSEFNDYFSNQCLQKYHQKEQFTVVNSNDLNNQSQGLKVVITIEGAHVFCNGYDVENDRHWDNWHKRILEVKNWSSPPFFITLAHHYYNGLCTHSRSLFIMPKLANQQRGMRDYALENNDQLPPISVLGKNLIMALLKKNENERRVLIDVKHMSVEARNEYYKLLKDEYAGENIPVIFSHGAHELFYNHQVNFNNTDLAEIYRSSGLIGIEMDKRILGVLEPNEYFVRLRNDYRELELSDDVLGFWFQLITIAEWATDNGYRNDPWKCISIGSDYDGIINALRGFYSVKSLYALLIEIEKCIEFYWQMPSRKVDISNTKEIINKIAYQNAYDFLKNNY